MKKTIRFLVYPLAVVLMSMVVIVGCSDDETEPVRPPTVTTLSISDITDNSAKSGGHVTDDGGGEILLRGVTWCTELTPSLAIHSGITFDGTGTGVFESIIAGLSAETTYYVRAFATNSAGASYGNEVMFETAVEEVAIIYGEGVADIDGNEYVTVIIDDREWMAENLRVTRYKNGDSIPTDLSYTEWGSTAEGAYAIFNHNNWSAEGINSPEEMAEAYGKLYNWYAVDDPRGLCPEGWSVPSLSEWEQLSVYIDPDYASGNNTVGKKLKSCRQVNSPLSDNCNVTAHPRWNQHEDIFGTDRLGFSALPSGARTGPTYPSGSGLYVWLGKFCNFYASTDRFIQGMYYGERVIINYKVDAITTGAASKQTGYPIRCIKD